MERLLLLEFAAVNRFHRGVRFPYLFGFIKRLGAEARWLRYGVAADTAYSRGEHGAGLDEAELAALEAATKELGATRVVINQRPSDSLVAKLRDAAPGVRIALLGAPEAQGEGAALETLHDSPEQWAAFVGGDPGGDYSDREILTPDFGFEPANGAAAEMQPLPFVVLGEECTYNRKLTRNRLYAELDLTGAVRRGGCTFCPRTEESGGREVFCMDEARLQMLALRKTLPFWPERTWIRLLGEPAIRNIGALAELLVELELPPVDILLDSRADELVRRRDELSAAAALVAPAGHRIQLALIGIENFVSGELERMNKGTTPVQNLDAILTLLELERDHPDSFGFRDHGGLSVILFTPWTTLEDLSLNLHLVRACRIGALCGKLLSARLRLEPALPITALAEKDGVFVERYDDPAFDTAARNLYSDEMPWRFLDPRMDPVCSILVRLSADTDFGDDPLAKLAFEARGEWTSRQLTVVDLAVEIVLAAEASGRDPVPGPEELLAIVMAGDRPQEALDAVLKDGPAAPERGDELFGIVPGGGGASGPGGSSTEDFDQRPAMATATAEETWVSPEGDTGTDFLSLLTKHGIKPVSKVEPVRAADVDALQAHYGWPNLRTRRRRHDGVETYELFFGNDASRVERAIESAALCEGAENREEEALHEIEVGTLLGYPRCCAEAHALADSRLARESYAWLQLSRRMAIDGPVSKLLNPRYLLPGAYVPCSLDCEASVEVAGRVLAMLREEFGDAHADRVDERLGHPWLFFLSEQGSGLELIPESEPGDRFHFRAGTTSGEPHGLRRAALADEIVLEPERLVLLRRGKLVVDLSLQAYLWWHERALQRELWSRVLAIRELAALNEPEVAVETGDSGGWNDAILGLQSRLTEALRGFPPTPELAPLRVSRLEPVADDRLVLALGQGEHAVELWVRDAATTEHCWFFCGPFAFSYPNDQPLDQRLRASAKVLARFLGPVVGRARPG